MSNNYLFNESINVLMLDNEEKGLEMIKNYFFSEQINIIIAKNIIEAQIQFKKNKIDCFIIDTALSNNKGFEFIQKLKNQQKLQHIPFVIITSRGFVKDRIQGYKSGCSAYLSKPFDPYELHYTIKNIVHQKNMLRERIVSNYLLIKKLRSNIIKKYKHIFKENINLELTLKEELILSYLLQNKRVKYITKKLKIQTRSVEKSISKIFDKTQTKNNIELKILPWNLL